MIFTAESVLITGGTGSFGTAFLKNLLHSHKFKGVIRVYSRDEFKQNQLNSFFKNDRRLRFLIGDVRDKSRLFRAMEGVDLVIHAAALKQVPALEYNPFEAVKTNILGTENVIDCAINNKVKKAVLVSSDKAVNPVNLYGATKLVAERLFIQGNSYVGKRPVKFSVVRYGNIVGSRGSVIPIFLEQAKNNLLTITDERMTRFWLTLEEGVKFVISCAELMEGGEIFVPKIPSFKIMELARIISPKAKMKIIGIRPGEKIHELLIGPDEARHTKDMGSYFLIEPEFASWKDNGRRKVHDGKELDFEFYYSSDQNDRWLTSSEIKEMLKSLND